MKNPCPDGYPIVSEEASSFADDDLLDEFLAAAEVLGPRDRDLLRAVIGKAISLEADCGADAACAMVDEVIAILSTPSSLDT